MVLAFFLFVSAMLASFNFTLGILAGGLISILNFYGLARGLRKVIVPAGTAGAGMATAVFKYLLRLVLTGLVLYLVLTRTEANIFGLVIGLSTVVVSVVFTVLLTLIDKSYIEEV